MHLEFERQCGGWVPILIDPFEPRIPVGRSLVAVGSMCPVCGLQTLCSVCGQCHYCEDIDLPC
jgi:hypothetical protein